MTRSSHCEENEQVVDELLERYGVEWELQEILPEFYNEKLSSESAGCLTVLPSENNGNGVFLAQFRLKKLSIPAEEEVAVETGAEDFNIVELDGAIKKRISTKTRQATPMKPIVFRRIPKHIKRSVKRLSIPRRLMGEVIVTPKQHRQSVAEERIESVRSSLSHLRVRPDTGAETDAELDIGEYIDIGIFGMSLKGFYGPRAEAMKMIKNEEISMKWGYPVFLANDRFQIHDLGSKESNKFWF